MRVLVAGLSARFAAELRTGGCAVERTGSAEKTIRALRTLPAPRLLVISEMLSGAGDVLAAIEADRRLATMVLVTVVGGRTVLASALRTRGLRVLRRRGAAHRLELLLRSVATSFKGGDAGGGREA